MLVFQGTVGEMLPPSRSCEEPVPAEQTQNSHHAAETALIEAAAPQPSQDLCGSPVLLPIQSSFLLRAKKTGQHLGLYLLFEYQKLLKPLLLTREQQSAFGFELSPICL